jgi:hypothetical protein
MSVISVSTVTMPPIIDSNACGRFHEHVVAKGCRHAYADQPLSVAHLTGPGVALTPAEAFGAAAWYQRDLVPL